jgi:hypothetical protein
MNYLLLLLVCLLPNDGGRVPYTEEYAPILEFNHKSLAKLENGKIYRTWVRHQWIFWDEHPKALPGEWIVKQCVIANVLKREIGLNQEEVDTIDNFIVPQWDERGGYVFFYYMGGYRKIYFGKWIETYTDYDPDVENMYTHPGLKRLLLKDHRYPMEALDYVPPVDNVESE